MQQDVVPTFHVGIIMDGNGRWASARGMERLAGHARGARRVTEIVRACPDLGITHLTLYAFSTENWQRPLSEVEGLMRIFGAYIHNKMDGLKRRNVRVRFIGMRHRVPQRLRTLMETLEAETRECTGLNLSIAIDYGGRDELTRAVRTFATRVAEGELAPADIDEADFSATLDTAEIPDPDLIVRTSGEVRISNFLLWQAAYAEYEFVSLAWPDFSVAEFARVLDAYGRRQRRFGDIAPSPAASWS